nr:exopolysaccharide biosynthesis protein [Rhizobium sp. Khangiran2]
MQSDIDLRSLLGIVRRQLWLILSIVVGLTALAAIITYSLEPRYSASAQVFVDTAAKGILDADEPTRNSGSDNARVDTEVVITRTDEILLSVINSENLVADDEFGVKISLTDRALQLLRLKSAAAPEPEEAAADVLDNFRDSVRVSRRGMTYVIDVTVTSEDPEKAARLANAVAKASIQKQMDTKVAAIREARDRVQPALEQARQTLTSTSRSIDTFIDRNIELLREQGSPSVGMFYDELTRIRSQRERDLQRLQTLDQTIRQNDYASLFQNVQSDAARELQQRQEELAGQIAQADSNEAIELRAELQRVTESIRNEAARAMDQYRGQLATAEQQETSIRSNLLNAVMGSNLPDAAVGDLYSLANQVQSAKKNFDDLSMQAGRMDILAALQLPDSGVISNATPPREPSYPRKGVILPLAFMMALGLGVGLAFVREYFVGGLTSEDQVETVLRLPLVSITPREAEETKAETGAQTLSDIIIRSPLSMFAESARRIRVAIDQHLFKKQGIREEGSGGTVIMVSSALPNEGKSTMALSLARTYALSGKRTLLIDCDLRKPSLHRHLGLEPSTGFVEFLRGAETGASLPKLTITDQPTGLTVLLSGRRSSFPTDDLFMGPEIARLIAVARRNFDYIILDTPPVEPVVDGLYLARHADVITFIVRWAVTPQASAKHAVAALRESAPEGTPILAVLNQQERAKLFGYYSYSDYYVD